MSVSCSSSSLPSRNPPPEKKKENVFQSQAPLTAMYVARHYPRLPSAGCARVLRVRYAIFGTDLGIQSLRCGTSIGDAARRCAVLTSGMRSSRRCLSAEESACRGRLRYAPHRVLLCNAPYLPTRFLCNAPYLPTSWLCYAPCLPTRLRRDPLY